MCDLIGLCFRIYNIDNIDYPDQQYAVNLVVVRISMRIDEINRSNGVCGPRFGGHTHKVRHGRLSQRYLSTLQDG